LAITIAVLLAVLPLWLAMVIGTLLTGSAAAVFGTNDSFGCFFDFANDDEDDDDDC